MVSKNARKGGGGEIKKLGIKNFILQNIGNCGSTRKFLSWYVYGTAVYGNSSA